MFLAPVWQYYYIFCAYLMIKKHMLFGKSINDIGIYFVHILRVRGSEKFNINSKILLIDTSSLL